MNLSELFIRRPVMTVALTVSVILFGVAAYFRLPVSDLPAIDYPVIQVQVPGSGVCFCRTFRLLTLARYSRLNCACDKKVTSSCTSAPSSQLFQHMLREHTSARELRAFPHQLDQRGLAFRADVCHIRHFSTLVSRDFCSHLSISVTYASRSRGLTLARLLL